SSLVCINEMNNRGLTTSQAAWVCPGEPERAILTPVTNALDFLRSLESADAAAAKRSKRGDYRRCQICDTRRLRTSLAGVLSHEDKSLRGSVSLTPAGIGGPGRRTGG